MRGAASRTSEEKEKEKEKEVTHVVLWPLDASIAPLERVTGPSKRPKRIVWVCAPCDFQLDVSALWLSDDGVEHVALRVLDQLSIDDLELGGSGGRAEDRIGSGADHFRLEVVVEVGSFLLLGIWIRGLLSFGHGDPNSRRHG